MSLNPNDSAYQSARSLVRVLLLRALAELGPDASVEAVSERMVLFFKDCELDQVRRPAEQPEEAAFINGRLKSIIRQVSGLEPCDCGKCLARRAEKAS